MSDEAVHVKPAGEVLRRVEVIPAPRQARCLCEDLNPSERPCVVCEVRAPAPTTPTEVKPGTCAEQEAMVRAHGAGQDSALRTVAGYLNLNEDATLAQIEQRISTLRELERAVIRGTSPAPSRPAAEVLEAEPAHVRGLTYHHEVSARTIYLEWEPGNGSCYRLLITLLSNLPALALRRMGFTREAALVTWENPPTHGPLTVKLRRAVAWRYIWDKWEGQSRVDVLEVARAIEAALGWDLLTSDRPRGRRLR